MVYQIPVWKLENFYRGGSQEQKTYTFLHPKVKNVICGRTPPTCTSNLIYMSAGKCRGPKYSNGIELSWFIQGLLHFKWLGTFPALAGVELGGSGSGCDWGCHPPCLHMHAHTHTCTHMCNTKIYMYRNCKWPPPCLLCLTCMHVCTHACLCIHVCMHVHVHVCGVGITHPPNHLPTHPQQGETSRISTNSISLEWIKIFQFCLKFGHLWSLLHLWVGVWFGGWMNGVRSNNSKWNKSWPFFPGHFSDIFT